MQFIDLHLRQVQLKSGAKPLFAMRVLKKRLILASGQREHILREGRILMETRCPFIVRYCYAVKHLFNISTSKRVCSLFIAHRLYKTFRDAECLFSLTEACLGGSLSSLLPDGCDLE